MVEHVVVQPRAAELRVSLSLTVHAALRYVECLAHRLHHLLVPVERVQHPVGKAARVHAAVCGRRARVVGEGVHRAPLRGVAARYMLEDGRVLGADVRCGGYQDAVPIASRDSEEAEPLTEMLLLDVGGVPHAIVLHHARWTRTARGQSAEECRKAARRHGGLGERRSASVPWTPHPFVSPSWFGISVG